MKEKINQLLKDVDNSYNMALIKLPKAVRQMPWLDHFSEWTRLNTNKSYLNGVKWYTVIVHCFILFLTS